MGKNLPILFLAGVICFSSQLSSTISAFGLAFSSDANSDETKSQAFRFEVERADFLCTKGSCGDHLAQCKLGLDYNIVPTKGQDADLDKGIFCSATISYQTAGGDLLQCQAGPETVYNISDNLSTHRSHIDFFFYFSYYEAVENAHLDSVNCYSDQQHYVQKKNGEQKGR